jgi:hypothetical protein
MPLCRCKTLVARNIEFVGGGATKAAGPKQNIFSCCQARLKMLRKVRLKYNPLIEFRAGLDR